MCCSDVVFTAAFTIEAVLKIIAFGFKPYLSFFQNIIDILIVISSLVMLLLDTMAEISVIKVRGDVCQGRQTMMQWYVAAAGLQQTLESSVLLMQGFQPGIRVHLLAAFCPHAWQWLRVRMPVSIDGPSVTGCHSTSLVVPSQYVLC